jgi:phage gp36-like protein
MLNNNTTLATVLQAKRLEELDRLYREEVVARKRAHNALQDAKGKIRVYCRVRPMLEFEAAKNQVRLDAEADLKI